MNLPGDIQKLAVSIAREVARQLQAEGSEAGKMGVPSSASPRPCVMILGARDAKVASAVRAHCDEEVDFLFFMEPAGNRTPCRYILPHLCPSAMADLALGRASGSLMTEVLRLILSGVPVEVLEFGYKAYEQTASCSLWHLYQGYEKTLVGFGVTEFRRKRPDAVRFHARLVTERDVAEARERGAQTLIVPAMTVVTPLAKEAAGASHITICRET